MEVLGEDKAFYVSKMALCADTEHNKLLNTGIVVILHLT